MQNIGFFDRQFEKQRMGDGEYGIRINLKGYPIISNPFAKRLHLKVKDGGLREMGSWDGLHPKNFFAPRPIPSVLYLKRKYFGNRESIYFLLQVMPFSFIPYRYKGSRKVKLFFLLLMPFQFILLLFVVLRSWKKSSKMLREGYLGPF